jgi:hypothetical protein
VFQLGHGLAKFAAKIESNDKAIRLHHMLELTKN